MTKWGVQLGPCDQVRGEACMWLSYKSKQLFFLQAHQLTLFIWKNYWWTTVTKLGYLADIFVKPSQGIFLLQSKRMTLFVAKDKIWNLKEKTDSLDKLYLLLWAWLLKKKRLFDGTISDLFLNIVYKICQHLEVLHYSIKEPMNDVIRLCIGKISI